MTQAKHPASIPPTARERIDALLDEALKESFPASDSSSVSSGARAIKEEHRDDTEDRPARR